MNKKYLLFGLIVGLISITGFAQEAVKTHQISALLDSALRHYPVSAQRLELEEMRQLTDEQLSSLYLPGIQLNGQVSYQSEVTSLQINFPGFSPPELAKDWYKVNLDVSQLVYDGGQVKQTKNIEDHNYKLKVTEIELMEHTYKEMLSKLYFRALLLRQQKKVYVSINRSLGSTANEMESGVKSGTVLAASLKSIQAEILRNDQLILETEAALDATLEYLSAYSGINIHPDDSLAIPNISLPEAKLVQLRPEWKLLNLQKEKTTLQQTLIKAKRRPGIQAFAQAGYGRPGYNMLEDAFSDYYMIGLRLNYKLWDWKFNKREQLLAKQSGGLVEKSLAAFEINQGAAYNAKKAEIEKIKQIVDNELEIILLQQEIVDSYEASLQQGIITSSVYLLEVEKFTRTLLSVETNRIKLINARAELMFITGKINFNE